MPCSSSVAYFSKFNDHGPSVIDYSQFEYDEQLTDPDWTPHETTYLFDLLRTYDLRFVIAADRYAYTGLKGEEPPRQRSVEVIEPSGQPLTNQDIKDRYYSICRRLVRTRTATDPQAQQQLVHAYSFDKGEYTGQSCSDRL